MRDSQPCSTFTPCPEISLATERADKSAIPMPAFGFLRMLWRKTYPTNGSFPYLQLHEFEALLFSDPKKFGERFDRHSTGISRLVQIAEQSNPELIDDGNESAPSKQIIREIPEYGPDKASSGPIVAERIGLPTLRAKCQHFAEWLNKLEALT